MKLLLTLTLVFGLMVNPASATTIEGNSTPTTAPTSHSPLLEQLSESLFCTSLLTYMKEELDYDTRTWEWLRTYKRSFHKSLKEYAVSNGKGDEVNELVAEKIITKVRSGVATEIRRIGLRERKTKYRASHIMLNEKCMK